tara:strand:+ start:183 stop:551 length:369 start_codon:yes stop_codon:yes gene_type:complete
MNKKVKSYKTEFFVKDSIPYWSVFTEYDLVYEKENNFNEKTIRMNEAETMLFQRLRDWRKERADSEGVPVYILATNRELTDIVKSAPKNLEALKSIKGYGKRKIEKYGNDIVNIVKCFFEKK